MLTYLVSDKIKLTNVCQWSNHNYDKGCTFKDKLTHAITSYEYETSLIYSGRVTKMKSIGRIPSSICTYKVYFSVCKNGEQCINPNEYKYPSQFREAISNILHSTLFMYKPNRLNFIACNGDKCRHSISVWNTGIWCTSCHGAFDSANNISELMYDTISINRISPKSLIHAEIVSDKPIDWADDKRSQDGRAKNAKYRGNYREK